MDFIGLILVSRNVGKDCWRPMLKPSWCDFTTRNIGPVKMLFTFIWRRKRKKLLSIFFSCLNSKWSDIIAFLYQEKWIGCFLSTNNSVLFSPQSSPESVQSLNQTLLHQALPALLRSTIGHVVHFTVQMHFIPESRIFDLIEFWILNILYIMTGEHGSSLNYINQVLTSYVYIWHDMTKIVDGWR